MQGQQGWSIDAAPCDGAARDRLLVDACLAGSRSAWRALFEEQNRRLLRAIACMLGPLQRHDVELIDEIAAQVWSAVVNEDCNLLRRFDESRGRLATYLAAIAKDQLVRFFRSERRRERREAESLRGKPSVSTFEHLGVSLEDIVASLTPSEREFFEHVLTNGASNGDAKEYSNANRWTLTSRIRAKLCRQLGMENIDQAR
jgi:DNA-directed RNA polymerase specialized sigma24 family protein